jgi:hypothetical protein
MEWKLFGPKSRWCGISSQSVDVLDGIQRGLDREKKKAYLNNPNNILNDSIEPIGMVVEVVEEALLCEVEDDVGSFADGLQAEEVVDRWIHLCNGVRWM